MTDVRPNGGRLLLTLLYLCTFRPAACILRSTVLKCSTKLYATKEGHHVQYAEKKNTVTSRCALCALKILIIMRAMCYVSYVQKIFIKS